MIRGLPEAIINIRQYVIYPCGGYIKWLINGVKAFLEAFYLR